METIPVTVENNSSALGDTICTLPALMVLLNANALDRLFVPANWYELFEAFIPKDKLINKEELVNKTITFPRKMVMTFIRQITTINMHLVDYSMMMIADALFYEGSTKRDYPYLKPQVKMQVPKDYVVINVNRSSQMRELSLESYTAIVRECERLNLKVVIVGKRYDAHVHDGLWARIGCAYNPLISEAVIDYRDKTTLLECHALIHDAKVLIAMDSGVMHLGGLTNTHIIAGFTCADPIYRAPIRNGKTGYNMTILEPQTGCRFCMNQTVMADHDFIACYTKTFECCKNITPAQWTDALRLALEANK